MKLNVKILIFCSLACLCCVTNSENRSGNSESGLDSASSSIESDANVIKLLDEEKLLGQRTFFGNHVKDLSRLLGIVDLENRILKSDEKEMRIWDDVGLDDEKVLIISSTNGVSTATRIEIRNESDGSKPILRKTNLDAPKSGWRAVENYLTENRIDGESFKSNLYV